LTAASGLTKDDLTGLTRTDGSKVEKDDTSVEYTDGKIVITKTTEDEAVVEDVENIVWGDGTADVSTTGPETLSEDEKTIEEDIVENGVVVGKKVTTIKTTKTRTTKTTETKGTIGVIQTRTVETTEIVLNNGKVSVSGKVEGFQVTEETANTETHGNVPAESSDTVTVEEVEVKNDDKLAALADAGFWGDNLEAVKTSSGIGELTAEEANDAMQAVMFPASKPATALTGNALAYYTYLMGQTGTETGAPEVQKLNGVKPEVQNTTITNITSDAETGKTTADVSLVVALAPSVTGDLLVTLNTQDGETQTERVQLDGGLDGDNKTVVDNGNGTFTITLHNVVLNGERVDLKITTSEDITERQVYQVTTTVPGGPVEHDDLNMSNEDLTFHPGNVETGGDKNQYQGENADFSYNPDDNHGGEVTYEGITIKAVDPKESNKDFRYAVITGPADKDIEVEHIIVKASDGYIVYDVPGGILHAGQSITVQSVDKDGTEVYGISHVCLMGVGRKTDPETAEGSMTTAYGMTETTKTLTAEATLSLNLTGSLPTATMETKTQEQKREGITGMTKVETTATDTTVIDSVWSSTETDTQSSTRSSTSTMTDASVKRPSYDPLPGDDDDDDDVTTTYTPGDDDDDDDDVTTTITEPPTPLAETPVTARAVETPVTEIADEEVPLAEEPELEDIFDEDVPLADVPETGDGSGMWYAIALTALGGLAALTLKKREEEEA